MPGRYPSWCLPQLDKDGCEHRSYIEIIGLGGSPKDVTLIGPESDHTTSEGSNMLFVLSLSTNHLLKGIHGQTCPDNQTDKEQ